MPKVHQASLGVERQVTQNLTGAGDLSDAARARPDALDQRQPARERGHRPQRQANPVCVPETRPDRSATSRSSTPPGSCAERPPGAFCAAPTGSRSRGIFMNLNYALAQAEESRRTARRPLPRQQSSTRTPTGGRRGRTSVIASRARSTFPIVYGVRTSINVQRAVGAPPTRSPPRIDTERGTAS